MQEEVRLHSERGLLRKVLGFYNLRVPGLAHVRKDHAPDHVADERDDLGAVYDQFVNEPWDTRS
jgi:hypothetical protein